MASTQDLDSRLRSCEDMLGFIMQTMRMKATVSSGVLAPNGQPVASNVIDATLLDLYRLSRQLPTVLASEAEPPPMIANG